ncbi:MAG TPA: retropepsin-like aspartic protease [Pyrinomonadaceae bacterium]|nr:retropepsin-like aspartic protease [Pyrinomonadaceae bacterium]
MSKAKLAIALSTLSVAIVAWAVPIKGIAHQHVEPLRAADVVAPIRLRDQRDRGLIAQGWINGSGPFVFVIDTGAGVSLINRSVVDRARLSVAKSRRSLVGGFSTSPISSDQESRISGIALGRPGNNVPGSFTAAVVSNLPGAIDGVLDPTDVFSPYGYSVDLPNQELRVFDTTAYRLRMTDVPRDGAVVRWVRESGSNRPFVTLSDGRLALLDTGSALGLALNQSGRPSNHGRREDTTHDLGGGSFQSRRIAPQTVSIGALVLNRVPTDMLTGVAPGTPIILGRGALFPFKITFDPASKLIAFEPTEK